MALTKKRRVFIEEYLKCWNATEAARRAGYKHPNVYGPTLVNLSEIKEIIDARIAELTMEADEVLLRLSEIARGEHAKYILEDGKIDVARMVQDDKAYLIVKIRELQHGGKHIEFCDMQKALVDIGRHHGLFQEHVDVTSGGQSLFDIEEWKRKAQKQLGDVAGMEESECGDPNA